jgi:hypothetical protein
VGSGIAVTSGFTTFNSGFFFSNFSLSAILSLNVLDRLLA